ncbi:MAG: transcriptional repressor [Bacteroidota bacterium]
MGIKRKTKSVKLLLQLFEETDKAIPAVELIERLREDMNKTTVYRILERLKEEGSVHHFIGKDGLRWYAKSKEFSGSSEAKIHPHFQCRSCGKAECLSVDTKIPSLSDYQVDSAAVLLVGLCKDCLTIT